MDILKSGDPCPCCGQPIKTKDPQLLLLLTLIRDDVRYREAAADAVYCAIQPTEIAT